MQCQWIKENGERCKAKAKKGEIYCAYHLKMAAQQSAAVDPTEPDTGSAPQESDMANIHNTLKKRKVRFIGKGSYAIPAEGVTFARQGQVEEVSYETWKRLLETQPDVFEEA